MLRLNGLGSYGPENQALIKRIVEERGADGIVVMLGAADADAVQVAAETVRDGDPAWVGPLAGSSWDSRCMFEDEVKAQADPAVYEAEIGFFAMTLDGGGASDASGPPGGVTAPVVGRLSTSGLCFADERGHTPAPLTAPRPWRKTPPTASASRSCPAGQPGEHCRGEDRRAAGDQPRPGARGVQLLRSEGLLNEEPRRGTFVVSLSTDDVRDIYGLRAALEGRAARTLARDRDPVAIGRLRSLADQIDAAVASGDAAAVSRADLAFHQGLCALCGNARIVEVFDRYVPTMRALLRLDGDVLGSLEEVSHQHRPLVDAIESGDEDTAARLFAEHAEEAGELIAGVVRSGDLA